MHTNLRNCPRCHQEFNTTTHIPQILYCCGHTFCSQCLQVILHETKSCSSGCPGTPPTVQVEQLPINITILEFLSNLSGLPPGFCSTHGKPQNFVCLNEYQKICVDCEEECSYKGHNTKNLRDVETKAERKKKVLQKFTNGFDEEYEEIDLSVQEEAFINEVDNIFECYKEAIKGAIHRFFEEKKKISDGSFNHDVELKKNANDLLKILDKKAYDQSYFDALHTPLDGFKICSQKPIIDAYTETIRGGLRTTLDRIFASLMPQDPADDLNVEQNGIQNHGEVLDNNCQDFMEKEEEQEMFRIETEEDYLKATSLFYTEIEENNRLILSFKNQQIETESILTDQEKLKTISKVTLQINKSKEWKDTMECLQMMWNKLDKVKDLKIDFSFKVHAKDILKALIEQNNIWANSDLSEFTINLSKIQVEDEHIIQLYEEAISKMVNLQRLEIVLEKTKITDQSVRIFAEKTLQNLPSLTDFRFYVDHTKVGDDAMESLLTAFQKRDTSLTGLSFGLDGTAVTDKTIENLTNSIIPMVSELRKFDLSVKKTNVSDNGIEKLSRAFNSQLERLQEFTLDLGHTEVSNKGLEFLGTTLPKMTSLEAFELFANEPKKITNSITKPIAKGLQSLRNLKKIHLELGRTEITGITLEKLSLKNNPALETFELGIAEIKEIKVTEINDFLAKIGSDKTFQNIKHLSFCFSQLNITDKSCRLLAQSIQQCTNNLQILQLILGKNKITDKGLECLSNGIDQVLQRTKLTEFKLHLDSTRVTDQGLKVFSNQVVKSLVGVKSFKLYLILLPDMTDQGAEALFQNLSLVAESLRDVKISLYGTNITDGCMETLSKTLWNAKPKLESFTLSIGKNENITDESLEWLLHNFKPILQSLTSLKLNVGETKVSQEGIGILKQYLQEVPNALEKLKIKVGENRNFQEMVQDLENILI